MEKQGFFLFQGGKWKSQSMLRFLDYLQPMGQHWLPIYPAKPPLEEGGK